MSDSGRQIGDCRHGWLAGNCVTCLRAEVGRLRVALAVAYEDAARVMCQVGGELVAVPCPDGIPGCAVLHGHWEFKRGKGPYAATYDAIRGRGKEVACGR